MMVDVRVRNCDPKEELRDHAEVRVRFRLSRFGTDVQSVDVSLTDLNGPKGGFDKQCQVQARGTFIGELTVQETSSDPFSAVEGAVDRLARVVARTLQRRREDAGNSNPRRRV
ncbi:MAG: Ribosomal subunit interface protein [Polyangiaceae bacterium]|jgi:ribosomal subunit interface protein|nr:Ribosomal subunit interface protein [Polyangiaceae bacterium]